MSKKTAWMVYHEFEDDVFCEHFKVIGFFPTRADARTVVRRLKTKPGFLDQQQGFLIGRPTLDGGSWDEGFHTMMGDTLLPEPEIPSGELTVLDFEIGHSPDGLWYVQHSYTDQWNCTETKPIGLYSDLDLAKSVVQDRLKQPGFRSRPTGFQIYPVTLGSVAYENGFDCTLNRLSIPRR